MRHSFVKNIVVKVLLVSLFKQKELGGSVNTDI